MSPLRHCGAWSSLPSVERCRCPAGAQLAGALAYGASPSARTRHPYPGGAELAGALARGLVQPALTPKDGTLASSPERTSVLHVIAGMKQVGVDPVVNSIE
jgi:hypothetical protein